MQTPDPMNIILKYFKASAVVPEAGVIAGQPVLAGILPVIVTALGTLHIVPLSGDERQGFKGKDPVNQRQVSRGLVRFATKRPDLAQKAEVDVTTFTAVIQKDEAFDILYNVLGQLVQIVDDGLLLLRAALSQSTTKVVNYVRDSLADHSVDPATATALRVYFGAVDLGAMQQADKAAGKQKRHEAKLKTGQAALLQAQGTLQNQSAVDKLIADAKAGVDPTQNLLPATAKGHKGGVK
jgi:hypothetical protein